MLGSNFFILCTFFILFSLSRKASADKPVWTWTCIRGYCQKQRITPGTENLAVSLAACQLSCLQYGALWPRPTGEVTISKVLVTVNINAVTTTEGWRTSKLIRSGLKLFTKRLHIHPRIENSSGKPLLINLDIIHPNITQLTLDTDESYSLKVLEAPDGRMNATVTALTYFGGRHGLETLGQLIIFDDIHKQHQMPTNVTISDSPVYPYRGVLLDTARNFISVAAIKRTIVGLAASKLNTFHWHITDSQSFPYVSKSRPELSKLGAYSESKVYSAGDIKKIVEFGRTRGVRVLPEFDAPAHVGEGWQDTDFVACWNKQPWQDYCKEPPCGQFDPTKPALYDALEDLYKDIIEQFNPDIFHMGGDEVSTSCWDATPNIIEWMKLNRGWGRNEEDFVKLWNMFQSQALQRFDKHTEKKIPIIMWTSTLTKKEYIEQYLPKDRYIIQVWTTAKDKHIKELLDRDYRLILSNYDALYLDCGFSSWVQGGVNWCSPYKGWQKIYDNSPAIIGGSRKHQFLGGEAALWTEEAGESSVDTRIWPRAAALAERLWAEPDSKWRAAQPRMLIHRERLVSYGINADELEPQWCLQHEESCPIGGEFNKK